MNLGRHIQDIVLNCYISNPDKEGSGMSGTFCLSVF